MNNTSPSSKPVDPRDQHFTIKDALRDIRTLEARYASLKRAHEEYVHTLTEHDWEILKLNNTLHITTSGLCKLILQINGGDQSKQEEEKNDEI